MSASADNRHRRDLDGHREGQRVGAERRTRVLARLAEDLNEKVGRAVDDFRLVAEIVGGVDKTDELRDRLHPVQADRRLDLGQHANAAQTRPSGRLLDRDLIGTAPGQHLVAVGGDLAGDVEQRPLVGDRDEPALDVCSRGRRRRRQRDSEFAEPILWRAQRRASLAGYLYRPRRWAAIAVSTTASAPSPSAMYGSRPDWMSSSSSVCARAAGVRTPLTTGDGVIGGPWGVPPVSWYAHSFATWVDGWNVAT